MMLKKSLAKLTCACALLGCSNFANADFNISGFASIVGGTYSEENFVYAGYDDDVSFEPDTLVGLQFVKRISDKLMVTGQFISDGRKDFDVEAELAYLTYSARPNWDIRAGRLRAPLYYYSDFVDVGYAYPWIRPPVELYGNGAFDVFEGIDTIYRSRIGRWDAMYQLFYGRMDTELGASDLELLDFAGVNVTFNRRWLTLRAGFVSTDLAVSTSEGIQGLIQTLNGAGFADLANQLDTTDHKQTKYIALAAIIDYKNWLVNAEFTTVDFDSIFITDSDTWFVMLGRRFDEFTAHITYSSAQADPDFEGNTIPLGVAPAFDQLHAIVDSALGNNEDSSLTFGIRYDVDDGVAVKAEVTRFERDIAEPLFTGQQSGVDDGTLLSIGVDVVF